MSLQQLKVTGAAVLAVAVLAACGQDVQGGSAQGGAQAAAQPLRVVGPFELHSIDPSTSGGFFTRLQVAETLVEADETGELQPGLATSWEASPDQLAWRFTLRPDARFHDGTEVTADAVVAALEIARGKEGTPLGTVPVDAISADGDAVRVELTSPFAPLPAVLAHTSTQILAPSSYAPDGTATQIFGSGPYRVAEIEQPANIGVVASEHWSGEAPAIEEVTYQAVGRAESRALMAESGQADVTFGIDPVSLQRMEQARGVDIVAVTLPRTIQMKVNAGHDVLGDVRVRRALSMAIDRDALATALLRDPEMAATQLFPESLPTWHEAAVAPLTHDPAAARALLEEAGWTPGDDGLLTRDGQPFEVSLRTFPDRPELPILATAIQASFAEVGITLDVEIGNSSEIPAGHQDGSLELALYARNFALVPDPLVTLLDDFGPEGADWGAMGWSDDTLTARLQDMAGGAAADEAAGREQVAQILQSELPVIPVAWYRQHAVVSERIDGFVLDPLERSWRLTDLAWSS